MWCSELKKVTIALAPAAFNLIPPHSTPSQEWVAWVENTTSNLLDQSVFLRNGFDDNVCPFFTSALYYFLFIQGKMNNFAHLALKDAIIDFFYTGSYHIAEKWPNIFWSSVPLMCLALVGAAVYLLFLDFNLVLTYISCFSIIACLTDW